jgi:hypothetical protein
MLSDLLIVALSTSFVLSFFDQWLNRGILRGAFVLAVAALLMAFVFDYTGWLLFTVATAAAFSALLMVLVGERLATPPPMVLDSRRARGL